MPQLTDQRMCDSTCTYLQHCADIWSGWFILGCRHWIYPSSRELRCYIQLMACQGTLASLQCYRACVAPIGICHGMQNMETIADERLFNTGLLVLMPAVVTRVYRSAFITNTESNYAWPVKATIHTFCTTHSARGTRANHTSPPVSIQTAHMRPCLDTSSYPAPAPRPLQTSRSPRHALVTRRTSPARRRVPRCGA